MPMQNSVCEIIVIWCIQRVPISIIWLTFYVMGKFSPLQTTFSNTFSWMKMCEFRLRISLKFVPKVPINNIQSLVQIMAWRRPGDKPLSEGMVVKLPTHTCVPRPQWVKCDHSSAYIVNNLACSMAMKSMTIHTSTKTYRIANTC